MQKSEVIEHYSRLLNEHGPTYRAGDHGSEQNQMARYWALYEMIGEETQDGLEVDGTVLDVGCGAAPMRMGHRWTGWDMVAEFGQHIFRGMHESWRDTVTFQCRDLYESTERNAFDYVITSGLFQFSDYHELRLGVSRMWGLCRKAIAFNALTKTDGTPGEHAHNPLTLLSFAMTLTPKLSLRTNYLSNECAIALYR